MKLSSHMHVCWHDDKEPAIKGTRCGGGGRRGEALADGWEWMTATVSGPSGQLWGSDPRPQPSILSRAAESTWKTVMGYLPCSPLLSRHIHVIVIELCMPFMARCDYSFVPDHSIAPASFFSFWCWWPWCHHSRIFTLISNAGSVWACIS